MAFVFTGVTVVEGNHGGANPPWAEAPVEPYVSGRRADILNGVLNTPADNGQRVDAVSDVLQASASAGDNGGDRGVDFQVLIVCGNDIWIWPPAVKRPRT